MRRAETAVTVIVAAVVGTCMARGLHPRAAPVAAGGGLHVARVTVFVAGGAVVCAALLVWRIKRELFPAREGFRARWAARRAYLAAQWAAGRAAGERWSNAFSRRPVGEDRPAERPAVPVRVRDGDRREVGETRPSGALPRARAGVFRGPLGGTAGGVLGRQHRGAGRRGGGVAERELAALEDAGREFRAAMEAAGIRGHG